MAWMRAGALLALAGTLSLGACQVDGPSAPDPLAAVNGCVPGRPIVTPRPVDPGTIPDVGCPRVDSVVVVPEDLSLIEGQFAQLSATVYTVAGIRTATWPITWTSNDPAIAGVDDLGVVTAIAAGTTTIVAEAGGVLSRPVAVAVEALPLWCGATLDFDDGAVPLGWSLELWGTGPGLVDQRFEARPVDSGAWLKADGTLPASVSRVVVEFDAEHVQNYWGMWTVIHMETPQEHYVAGAWTADYNLGPNMMLVRWGPWNSQAESTTVPYAYGMQHHTVTITNTGLNWTVMTVGGQPVVQVDLGAVAGFSLADVTRFGFRLYTTSGASLWADNLSVTCE